MTKILTKHPLGKRGVSIDADKYEKIRLVMLEGLMKKEMTTS